MRRFFHIHSDRKTVKEISWTAFRKMSKQDWDNINKRLLVAVFKNWISLSRGSHVVGIRREQLIKILEATK